MRAKSRVWFWDGNALTDVEQDGRGFKNLVIDILQRYVGSHVLLNKVLREDNWECVILREHDARELRRCSERERSSREAPNRKE